jgi:DHA2 family lincomycin resistance protein-like MFS transporter
MTTSTTAVERGLADAAVPTGPPRGGRSIIALLMCAAFVVVLNETIMSVALPTLMSELSITASAAQWLTTAFLLTSAVVVPATGFLLRRYTLRALFITAMSLFTVGTAIAALSPEIGALVSPSGGSSVFAVLLVARVIQASGSAIMLPLMMTTVLAVVPPARRGSIMGLVSIVMSVAPAIGPTVSGLILSTFEWRFLFVFVLPISIGALLLGALRLRNITRTQRARLDVFSVVLSAVAFGGLIYGLSSLGQVADGTEAVPVWMPLTAGTLGLVGFVWRQIALRDTDRVLLDLRVFQVPSFTVAIVLIVAVMTALFGALIVLPLYLQQVLGLDTFETGLVLLPGGILMGALAPIVGRLYDRFGQRVLVLPGIVTVSGALWWMTTLDASAPVLLVVAMHCVLGIGFAVTFTPLMTSGLGSLPVHLHSHGTAVLSTLQKVAGATGTALFIAVMTIGSSAVDSGATAVATVDAGTHAAFLAGALLSLASVVLAGVATLTYGRR